MQLFSRILNAIKAFCFRERGLVANIATCPNVVNGPMFSLVLARRPGSHNRKKAPHAKAYCVDLVNTFIQRYPKATPTNAPLYCRVYYFYRKEEHRDPDNLSKPTLDALCNYAYLDDFSVKIRVAGSQDVGTMGLHLVDLTRMDPEIVDDFSNYVATQDHTIYIEIGELRSVGFQIGGVI